MARILILDDDYDLARAWRRRLVELGHEVDLAQSSSEAIALAEARRPGLVIVDLVIRLDAGDISDSGAKMLTWLRRSHPGGRDAPAVIGVSGFRPTSDGDVPRHLYHAYGVEDFLPKPFSPDALAALVETVLARTPGRR